MPKLEYLGMLTINSGIGVPIRSAECRLQTIPCGPAAVHRTLTGAPGICTSNRHCHPHHWQSRWDVGTAQGYTDCHSRLHSGIDGSTEDLSSAMVSSPSTGDVYAVSVVFVVVSIAAIALRFHARHLLRRGKNASVWKADDWLLFATTVSKG